MDRCYALSALSLQQQHDSSRSKLYMHALRARLAQRELGGDGQPSSSSRSSSSSSSSSGADHSTDTDGPHAREHSDVPLSVYEGAVSRLLADRLHLSRSAASQRRQWFELLERRVQQRDERIVRLERERAAEVEQWRSKQRALEHEVSRLRVELQLHNAASNQASAEGQMAAAR